MLESARQAYDDRVDGAWPAATVSEALLAGRDCDGAELWLYRFLHHPEVTPFAVESYERQIREIWKGDALGGGRSCADRLASILARHVARTQARLSLAPAEIGRLKTGAQDTSAFEKNFSGEGTFSLDTLKRLVDACASIAVVCNARGERLGTGFLVAGADVRPRPRARVRDERARAQRHRRERDPARPTRASASRWSRPPRASPSSTRSVRSSSARSRAISACAARRTTRST